jgi:hypothetical protein
MSRSRSNITATIRQPKSVEEQRHGEGERRVDHVERDE